MPEILECHSRGDKRFSALFAGPITYKGVQARSIEGLYQGSKVIDGRARQELYQRPGWEAVKSDVKGKKPEKFLVGELEVPLHFIKSFYNALWFKYLDDHPDLAEEAMEYENFRDPFAREGSVSQAEAIAFYVSAKKSGKNPWSSMPLGLRDDRSTGLSSVLSFPDRGPWGSSRYSGNTSGHVVKALLEFFRPKDLFVDPAEGSGTSREVAGELGVPYMGFDLHSGFNLLKDPLVEHLPRQADFVFFHPPYHNIIRYSGKVWGADPHPDDLSRCANVNEFISKMQVALVNIYDAVKRGGAYSVMIGDVKSRSQGYLSFQSDIVQIAPGKLDGILVKVQHNPSSNYKKYPFQTKPFIPIAHEYILNFKKEGIVVSMLGSMQRVENKLMSLGQATWNAVVKWAVQSLGGRADLQSLYEKIQEEAPDKLKGNENWQAKVRQTLQRGEGVDYEHEDRGLWAAKR